MKNLKRVLALTLVVAMMFTFAISASAATTKTYSDQDQITHADAAAVLTELGVLKGYEDGSFKPTANVTRAEMAKMITVILNKGVDNQSMFTDGTTDLTDINWHWAKGYITYCYTLGIIAGDGAPSNTFRPDDNVTGTEAAKMLLVALGADVTQEGLTGTNWDVKANALANSTGLFDDTTDAVNAAASRDFVVQMVYNMLSANTIEYNVNYFTGISTKMTDTDLAITKYFGAKKYVGVVIANEFASLDGDDALSSGKTEVAVKEINNEDTDSKGNSIEKDQTFNVSTDEGYLGRRVNLFYNETTKKIIGNPVIKSTDNVVVAVQGKLDDAVKAAGLKLVDGAYELDITTTTLAVSGNASPGIRRTDKDATVYMLNYDPAAYHGIDASGTNYAMAPAKYNEIDPDAGYSIVAISNDDSSTVNYVFYVAPVLTEVTQVEVKGPNKEYTFKGLNFDYDKPGTPSEGSVKSDDIVTSIKDIARYDYVLVTEIGGTYYVDAPETITSAFTSKVTGKVPSLTIGGETLGLSAIQCLIDNDDLVAYTYVEDPTVFTTKFADLKYGTEYTYYKDTLGNIAAVVSSDSNSEYAFLTGLSTVQGYDDTYNARLLQADGTSTSYEIKDAYPHNSTSVQTKLSNIAKLWGVNSGLSNVLRDGVATISASTSPMAVTYELSGSKVNLKEVTTVYTTNWLAKEKSAVGNSGLYGDSKTVYYYAVTGTDGKVSYYNYTGYTNAPTVTNDKTGHTTVWAVAHKTKADVAAAVYVWVEKADYNGVSSKDYVFIGGEYKEYSTYTEYTECVYIAADGTIKYGTITTDETYKPWGVYEYALKSAGVYELDSRVTPVYLSSVSSVKNPVIRWTTGSGGYANVTSTTEIITTNPDGKVEAYSGTLAVGDQVVVLHKDDTTNASFIYYIGSSTELEIATAAAENRLAAEIDGLVATDWSSASWLNLQNKITAYENQLLVLIGNYNSAVGATAIEAARLAVETFGTSSGVTNDSSYLTDVTTARGNLVTVAAGDAAIALADINRNLGVWTNVDADTFADAGVTGVTAANLVYVLAAIDDDGAMSYLLDALQDVVDVGVAIAKIDQAVGNTAANTITISDLNTAVGSAVATPANLTAYQNAIRFNGASLADPADIAQLISDVDLALAIEAAIADIDSAVRALNTDLYTAASVSGLTSAVASLKGTVRGYNAGQVASFDATVAVTALLTPKTQITAVTIGTAAPAKDGTIADGANTVSGASSLTVTWSDDGGGDWTATGTIAGVTVYKTKYVYTADTNYIFTGFTSGDVTITNTATGTSATATVSTDTTTNDTLTIIVTWAVTGS